MAGKLSSNTALNLIKDSTGSSLLPQKLTKIVTFLAASTGAIATKTIATVTGVVALSLFAVCSTSVVGSGTIKVGITNDTDAIIAQTTGTDIDTNDIWWDATPDAVIELTSVLIKNIIKEDVVYQIETNTLTDGVVTFYILWAPISLDGNVVIA